jgi:outer membrane protein OmpA-like peptidoglycan-associated protein
MTRFTWNLVRTGLVCVAVWLAAPLSAIEVQIATVPYPDNKTVEVPLAANVRVAPAQAEAEVRYRNGQAGIEISYKKLPPALLFSGDVTSYVVWAVARDGATENLGELIVRKQSGDAEYRTGQKEFGLLITAEPYPMVLRPSELVVFTSIAPPPKKARSTPVTLSSFAPAPTVGNPNIGSMVYSGKESLDLIQAQSVMQQAQEIGAEKYAPDAMRDANISLAQATNSFKDGQTRQAVDYARRSVSQASTAIRTTQQKMADEAAAAAAAQRAAQMKSLEDQKASAQRQAADAQAAALSAREQALAAREQAAAAQAQLNQAQQQAAAAQQQMTLLQQQAAAAQQEAAAAQERAAAAGLSAEAADAARRDADAARQRAEELASQASAARVRAEEATAEASAAAATLASQKQELETRVGQSEAELARLRAERNDLEGRLNASLSEVAQISQTARGVVVNLPDILFDTNKATLKQNAQVALAKLAGIVSLFPNINLRIEGHTDSTGGDAINVPLSRERAQSVMDFLNSQGVAASRMKAEGYAARIPVADNATPEGRSRNRRVEIILAEGVIAPASQ